MRIYSHAPWPGPSYWAFRCRVCGEYVSDHAGFFERWRYRRVAKRAATWRVDT